MSRISSFSSPWKSKGYITYRRFWLDHYLNKFSSEMRGVVIDFGGKRENKRGTFQPPETQALVWWYLNLDLSTYPNIFADVNYTPLQTSGVDCILCTEVLEHIPNPQSCVEEIRRTLRNDGVVFVSVPFFYPIHADPNDFQRYTEDGLRYLFRDFKSIDVFRMGGYLGSLGLMLELGIAGVLGNGIKEKILRWIMKWSSRFLITWDIICLDRETEQHTKFTTGYFLRAVR
ncbi:MAG TPA: methyltransferase domain-containing protein [Anaerolineales bacterium]|nr:methyltransferase domain-containing protein [Anaerolineales bacterium]